MTQQANIFCDICSFETTEQESGRFDDDGEEFRVCNSCIDKRQRELRGPDDEWD